MNRKEQEEAKDRAIQEFLYQHHIRQKQGLTAKQIQQELTELGYSDTIVSDWASVNYSYEWLVDLLEKNDE